MIDYLDENIFETNEDKFFDNWVLKMLCYHRIDKNKRIDPAKSNNSKECMVCHYWFFKHRFKFQGSVCNSCHDLTMLCFNISNTVIVLSKVLIIAALFRTLPNLMYKNLVIYFTRYVCCRWIKILCLHYYELMRKIEDYKEIIGIENFDNIKILIDTNDKLQNNIKRSST